jgi:hypothetical protein
MVSFVSSWKTNPLFNARTPWFFWVFALLITLFFHILLIYFFHVWLTQKSPRPKILIVEWQASYEKPILKKMLVEDPILPTSEKEELDLLNDLIQKEPVEKLSMKMLKTAKKNDLSLKSLTSPDISSDPSGFKKENQKNSQLEANFNIVVEKKDEINSSEEKTNLKDFYAFILSQKKDEEFPQLNTKESDSGKMESLPDDWMLRKNPKKSNEEPKLPGLRSLIQNTWSSELSEELWENPPPPPSGNSGVSIQGSGFYTLSSYDWPYESYMGRWAKALVYHWRNNPPMDYVARLHPQGGEVFVLVSLNRSGELNAYEVTQVHQASGEMEHSVISAVLSSSQLPPLPDDHESDLLQVHFRFIYPPIRIKNI